MTHLGSPHFDLNINKIVKQALFRFTARLHYKHWHVNMFLSCKIWFRQFKWLKCTIIYCKKRKCTVATLRSYSKLIWPLKMTLVWIKLFIRLYFFLLKTKKIQFILHSKSSFIPKMHCKKKNSDNRIVFFWTVLTRI